MGSRIPARRRALIAAVGVAVLAAAAACGPGPTSSDRSGGNNPGKTGASAVYKKLNDLPADKQRSTALAMAKKDGGGVSFYTSYASDSATNVKKAFEDKFGIPMHLYRGHSTDVLQRVLQESSAGRQGADAVEAGFLAISPLADQGLFTLYRGSHREDVPAEARFPTWTSDYFELMVPVWNTDQVSAKEAPRSWDDLADPRFGGKMIFDGGDFDWYAALTLYWKDHGKSAAQVDRLWKDIVDGAHIADGHSTMIDLLGAGQSALAAMDYTFVADVGIEKGAPVAYRLPDGSVPVPAFRRPNGLALMKNAAHPAAAWLLADWLLDPQGGQRVIESTFQIGTTLPKDSKLTHGITYANYPVDELVAHRKKWETAFDALVRKVPQEK